MDVDEDYGRAGMRQHWSKQEDALLSKVMHELTNGHPTNVQRVSWLQISKRIPGRSSKQCRERWKNHLCPSVNTNPWTSEEEACVAELLEEAAKELEGEDCKFPWRVIAQRLADRGFPGRTDNAIKNRWHSASRRVERAKARADGTPPSGRRLGPTPGAGAGAVLRASNGTPTMSSTSPLMRSSNGTPVIRSGTPPAALVAGGDEIGPLIRSADGNTGAVLSAHVADVVARSIAASVSPIARHSGSVSNTASPIVKRGGSVKASRSGATPPVRRSGLSGQRGRASPDTRRSSAEVASEPFCPPLVACPPLTPKESKALGSPQLASVGGAHFPAPPRALLPDDDVPLSGDELSDLFAISEHAWHVLEEDIVSSALSTDEITSLAGLADEMRLGTSPNAARAERMDTSVFEAVSSASASAAKAVQASQALCALDSASLLTLDYLEQPRPGGEAAREGHQVAQQRAVAAQLLERTPASQSGAPPEAAGMPPPAARPVAASLPLTAPGDTASFPPRAVLVSAPPAPALPEYTSSSSALSMGDLHNLELTKEDMDVVEKLLPGGTLVNPSLLTSPSPER